MRIAREIGRGTSVQALRERKACQERADAHQAALPVQRLRPELHGHTCPGQAAGPEGGCCAVVRQRLVHEPHRQVAGRLDPHHPGLVGAVRGRLRPEARAGGPGGGDRARRDVALPEKKSEPLWVWKAWDRASGQLVDGECGGRDKATCERLIERLRRWRTRLYCADDYAVYGVLLPLDSCTRARMRHMASNGTTPASGIGWRASEGAPSWSQKPREWWTSASPCSPASLAIIGS